MALIERLVLALELDANGAVANARRFEQEVGRALTPVEKLQQQLRLGFQVGAGAAAGAFSVAAIGGVAQSLVASAQAAEADAKAKIVLERTLRNVAGAYSDTVNSVEDFIETTRAATGIDDGKLRSAFQTLVRSTRDVDEAQRLLSTTLDVSAGTGRDVETVATGITKAYEGNAGALARLIPELSDAVREGASWNQVLRELQQTYGGTQAEANQFSATERLKSTYGELQETVGLGLVGALGQAADALDRISAASGNAADGASEASVAIKEQERNASALGFGLQAAGGPLAFLGTQARRVAREQADAAKSTSEWRDAQQRFNERFAEVEGRIRSFLGLPSRFANEVSTVGVKFDEASIRAVNFANIVSQAFGILDATTSFDNAIASLTEERTSGAAAARQRVLSEFEIESAARSVTRANEDLAEAEQNLADLRRGASAEEQQRADRDIANAAQRSRISQVRLADAENELRRAQTRGTVADQTKAQLAYESALLDVQNATEDQSDAQRRKNDLDQRGQEGSKTLADAVRRVEDAQFAVRSAYESQRRLFEQDAGSGGPGATVGRSIEAAFRGAQKAASNVVDEMLKAGKPIDDIIGKANELRDANLAAGRAAGLPDSLLKQADAYYTYLIALARYQNYLNTTFKLGQDPDGYEGLYLQQGIDSARGQFQAAGRAAGGAVMGGMWYEVNESRREYFKPNGNGTIMPIGSGGGGMGNSYNFNFAGAVVATDVDLERLIVDTLDRAKRRGWN